MRFLTSPLLGGENLYSLRFTWAFLGQARTFYDTTLVVLTSGGAPTQFYSSIHTNKESKWCLTFAPFCWHLVEVVVFGFLLENPRKSQSCTVAGVS
jgi:hypothetical protein